METKASYTIVGAFVLALSAALFTFVVWLAKVQFDQVNQPYYIYVTGTVTGLVEGSPVRYRGVAVGTVTDIRIDPENVELVRVTIEVPEETPIKTDAVATLEPVGITGGIYVEIEGGSRQAALLREVADDIPVIPSRASSIAEVLAQAPDLLENLVLISKQVSGFLTAENQQALMGILNNLSSATQQADATLTNADALIAEVRKELAAISVRTQLLLENTNSTVVTVGEDAGTISTELAQTSRNLRALTASLVATSNQLTAIIEENREPVRDFTNTALYDFGLLITQLQDLTQSLSRITDRLERDPSELLFGGSSSGVRVQ